MIESPLIQEFVAERLQNHLRSLIVNILQDRFGNVPPEMGARLKTVQDDAILDQLAIWAGKCPDLDAFRARLS